MYVVKEAVVFFLHRLKERIVYSHLNGALELSDARIHSAQIVKRSRFRHIDFTEL